MKVEEGSRPLIVAVLTFIVRAVVAFVAGSMLFARSRGKKDHKIIRPQSRALNEKSFDY